MKKISYGLAALALIFAIGVKVSVDLFKPAPTYSTMPRTTPADAAANGICRGTLTVEVFAPEMGVTQDDVDAYAKKYKDEARSCDELTYLGNVDFGNGTVDYIYRMRIAGKPLWYIFSVDANGKISNIQ